MAAIGASISGIARKAREIVRIPVAPRLTENGLPAQERIARTSGKAISVAQGKRNAIKARNVKRHRAAVRRAA